VLKKAGVLGGAGLTIGIAGCSSLGGDDADTSGDDASGDEIEEFELMMTTADYDPIRYEFGQLIAEKWSELGFEVEQSPTAFNVMSEQATTQQKFDTYTLAMPGGVSYIDPDFFTYEIGHSSNTEEGGMNWVNYKNEEYDEYAEEQRRLYDEEERREAVYKCQEIMAEDQPRSPVASQKIIMPYNSERFEDVVVQMGEGLMSFWTAVDSVPSDGVSTLRLGYPSDVNSLNPLDQTAHHDQQTMRLIYDRLARINLEGRAEPWVATEIDAVDETTIRVTIREGHTWHDGEDLTVEDVKFTFEYTNEHSPGRSAATEPIEDIEIVDENQLEFHLSRPSAPFIINALAQIFLIPKHIWEDIPDETDVAEPVEWENSDPVGSGPFKFADWRRDEEMRLEAFEDHFHSPQFEELIKVPGSDLSSLTRMIEDEQIDMIGWVPGPDTINRLETSDYISLTDTKNHGWYHINYHCEREPFDDPAVRRALADAIPKQDIVDLIMDGRGTVTNSSIPEANEFWHNPDIQKFGDNLDRARDRLEEAGYTWEDGRIHYPAE